MSSDEKIDWKNRLERYMARNPKFAIERVLRIIRGNPLDWDDNVPESWALELAEKWGVAA